MRPMGGPMQQSAVRPQGEALRQLILALIAPYLLPEIGSPDCRSDAALLNGTRRTSARRPGANGPGTTCGSSSGKD